MSSEKDQQSAPCSSNGSAPGAVASPRDPWRQELDTRMREAMCEENVIPFRLIARSESPEQLPPPTGTLTKDDLDAFRKSRGF